MKLCGRHTARTAIGGQNWNPFHLALGDEQSVEGISMVGREPCDLKSMEVLNRQWESPRLGQELGTSSAGSLGTGSRPWAYLMAISQLLTAEKSSSFSPSSRSS